MLIAGGGIVRIRPQFQDLAREMRDLCRMVQVDDVKTLHGGGLVRTDHKLDVEAQVHERKSTHGKKSRYAKKQDIPESSKVYSAVVICYSPATLVSSYHSPEDADQSKRRLGCRQCGFMHLVSAA